MLEIRVAFCVGQRIFALKFNMYIRLVLPLYERLYGGEAGFFHKAYDVCRSSYGAEKWLRVELREQLDWFDTNLAVPDQLGRYFKRRRSIHGLCWFQPTAKECIARARYSAWLMTEAGSPVREIRVSNPGEVIWKDEQQLVAKAARKLPRAFR